MTLTGVDPFDPTPGVKRELIFGAGPGSVGVTRDVILYGNLTSPGVATLDTLTAAPLADDADVIRQFGRRSELRAMYRAYVAVDPTANIWAIPLTTTGTAATGAITVANASDNVTSCKVEINGVAKTFQIEDGDAIATTVAQLTSVINEMDDSSLMMAATDASPVVNVSTLALGPRALLLIGSTATTGIRITLTTASGTQTQTITKGAPAGGANEDDGAAAFAAAALSDKYYHVFPWDMAGANINASDGQFGEASAAISSEASPTNSKQLQGFMGQSGTSVVSNTAATDAQLNNVRCKFIWHQGSDLVPCQLAAIGAGIHRRAETGHPAANLTGYSNSDSTPFPVPDLFASTDVPTATEIRTALNGGVCPISQGSNGGAFLVRSVTNRWSSDAANSTISYTAREGHIVSAIDFAWEYFESLWLAQKQDFVADDLKNGEVPTKNTTYPAGVKAMLGRAIEELAGPTPLGLYDGPILAPDKVDEMLSKLVVTKLTAGISVQAELFAVEHLLKFEGKFLETGAAY